MRVKSPDALPTFPMPEIGEATIADLMVVRARAEPGFPFLRFGDRTYTFGQVNTLANRLANALAARGVRPGDRVAVMLPSQPMHIVTILALVKAGLIRIPVNINYKGAALDLIFNTFTPAALICDRQFQAVIQPLVADGRIPQVLWNGTKGGDLAALMEQASDAPPAHRTRPTDVLVVTPSSGTTGAPKGILKTDVNMRAGSLAALVLSDTRPGDVYLLWESLHHGSGVGVIFAAIIERITLVQVERFSASKFWDQARRFGVTHIHYLGGVLGMLLKQPPRAYDRDHNVRIAWGGGCPPQFWDAFCERFGVEMREGWGLTEVLKFVTINPDGVRGSIGKPLSYFDVRIVNDADVPVAAGDVGEVIVRHLNPDLEFRGNFGNEEASRRMNFKGEWFYTGDLARADADGNMYFAGRRKDMVRRRGINITAWEVERIIDQDERVAESALVGVPSDIGDEDLKIFIRKKPDAILTAPDVIEWCLPRMPKHQVPRYVAFIDEFPKTPTQRIRKSDLSRSVDGVWDLEAQKVLADGSGL